MPVHNCWLREDWKTGPWKPHEGTTLWEAIGQTKVHTEEPALGNWVEANAPILGIKQALLYFAYPILAVGEKAVGATVWCYGRAATNEADFEFGNQGVEAEGKMEQVSSTEAKWQACVLTRAEVEPLTNESLLRLVLLKTTEPLPSVVYALYLELETASPGGQLAAAPPGAFQLGG